jgi:hypothetical protein
MMVNDQNIINRIKIKTASNIKVLPHSYYQMNVTYIFWRIFIEFFMSHVGYLLFCETEYKIKKQYIKKESAGHSIFTLRWA